jgi:hypothetical protein
MATELLILPLHLIQSALGQKVEAKPRVSYPRERSQGRVARRGREVACLPGVMGSHLGRSRGRETPSLSKSVLSASFVTGRAAVHAVSGALMTPVLPAITSRTRNVPLTDEVPRRPLAFGSRVSRAYKSDTKGPAHAPVTGRVSPQPRLQGCRQRQSRGARSRRGSSSSGGSGCSERQNLRVPCGPLRFMGPVSPAIAATQWPDGTSSCQLAGSLRNSPQQPEPGHAAVRHR